MPLSPYIGPDAFDPEALRTLTTVFEGAWQYLVDKDHIAATPANAHETRDTLARRIIELAQRGERDPHRLREHALAYLATGEQT
jgi:hypothetical protein